MNKEILDEIIPTMDIDNIVELVHNHLCVLKVIENKNREDIKLEYGLNEDIEDNSKEELIKALYKMNKRIMENR